MNPDIRLIIIIVVLVFISGCNRDGPLLNDIPAGEISGVLDRVVPPLMVDGNVVGMSVIVIREGKISIAKSFGYADNESGRKVDERTVFRAASLGKPIFSYIVVSLAQQGEVDLDAPLYSYLNEEVVKGDRRSKMITARMVLDHTTGLANLDGNGSEAEFLFEPGTNFNYSGHAYLYLQRVIENISGRTLNHLANELLFQPLKMTDSSFVWKSDYRGRISSSYDNSGELFQSEKAPIRAYSAWSLFTTTKDYACFVSHMMRTANVHGSVAEEILKPHVDVARNVKWGLGWGLQETVPHYSFWHWGSMAGFRHYIVGYPNESMAVIVMTNSSSAFKVVDNVMVKAIGGSYPSYDWF